MTTTLVIFVLVLLLSRVTLLRAGSSNSNNETKTHSIYLLVLLPYPDLKGGLQPSWSGGPNVLPAIEMAVEDINRKTGILDDYNLDLITGDGGCNITDRATTSLVENLFYQKAKQPVGIIGPGCSASTLHTAPIAGKDEVALISAHGASTPKLEDREKYPYVFGGFASLKGYAQAIAGFIKERQWTRIAVLYDASRVFHKTAFTEITKALSPLTEIEFSSGIYPSFLPIDQIKQHFLKVTIVLAGPKLVRKILCLSHHEGLSFPSHQFLIFERHLSELVTDVHFVYSGRPYFCSNETMLNVALKGNLLSEYRVSPLNWSSSSTINGTSYDEFMTEYERRIQLHKQNTSYEYHNTIMKSIWGAVWYDLVWAMATALNNAELRDGVNLQTYGVGMRNVTRKIYSQFQELEFEGMSGNISFDQNSPFVRRKVDVYQVVSSEPVYVAVIDGSQVKEVTQGMYTESEYPTVTYRMNTAATVTVLFLVSVGIVALLLTHLLTLKYRNHTAVKGSSPRLQQLAYVGCYLLVVATISQIVPQAFKVNKTVHVVLCHIINTCFSCGYTLIIGTVCAKTWRLYRIFCHYQKPGKMLADRFLFIIVILLTLVDVIANAIWAATDRFVITPERRFDSSKDNDTIVIETITCTSAYHAAWTAAIITYNVCILIVAVCLAILTRKVQLPQFQTKTVIVLAYTLFLVFGLGIPLILILDKTYAWTAVFLVTVLLCILLLFLPPLLPAFKRRKYTRQVHAQPSKISLTTYLSHSL